MNMQMIKLSEMRQDLSYQREPNEDRITDIAIKWDDMKANLIHVSHRSDGFYYVMDGNHTRHAAAKAGIEELPSRVYEGLTVKDEARIFCELNTNQKKPKYGELLKAHVEAGKEPESSYVGLLRQIGIPFAFSTGFKGKVLCHSTLLKVFRKHSVDEMRRALRIAFAAADGRETYYQVGFFPGICSLVVLHPEVDECRLISLIKKTPSSHVLELANNYKNTANPGATGSTAMFRKAYVNIYNKGLRKNKLEE